MEKRSHNFFKVINFRREIGEILYSLQEKKNRVEYGYGCEFRKNFPFRFRYGLEAGLTGYGRARANRVFGTSPA